MLFQILVHALPSNNFHLLMVDQSCGRIEILTKFSIGLQKPWELSQGPCKDPREILVNDPCKDANKDACKQ